MYYIGSDTIKVLYIDYGNSEEVKTDTLVEIPPSLGSIEQMANKLVLHNCYAHDLSDQNVSKQKWKENVFSLALSIKLKDLFLRVKLMLE